MANPRKFSEKIALQKQKQAEGTAEFERIMKEVYATKMDETQANQKIMECCLVGEGAVGKAGCAGSDGASPDGTAGVVGGGCNSPNIYRESRGRSVGVGPMRRPSERKQDRSPYGSSATNTGASSLSNNGQNIAYLSPPIDSSWRRSNSDSALHQSLNTAVATESNFGVGGLPAISVEMGAVHPNYQHHNQRSHSPNIGRSYSPQAQRKGSILQLQQQHQQQQQQLELQLQQQQHQMQQQHQLQQQQHQPRQHSHQQQSQPPSQLHLNAKFFNCNMPANNIFKTLQEQALATANTGSLPDLTSVRYATPSQQQLMHQQQQQTLSPVMSPLSNTNSRGDRDQSSSPFSPGNCGEPPSPFHQQQHSPVASATTPVSASQASPHLSFTNLAGPSARSPQQAALTGGVSMSYVHLPTLGAANSTGNLTDYRQPLNPPSPGSSPGLLTSASGNDIHSSAPSSPARHPQKQTSLQQQQQGYNAKAMPNACQRYSESTYNSLNHSFHNHFEQFSLGDSSSSPNQQRQHFQQQQSLYASLEFENFGVSGDGSAAGGNNGQQQAYTQTMAQNKLLDFNCLSSLTGRSTPTSSSSNSEVTISTIATASRACNSNSQHQRHPHGGRTLATSPQHQQQLLNNNSGSTNASPTTNCRVNNNPNNFVTQQNDASASPLSLGGLSSPSSPLPIPISTHNHIQQQSLSLSRTHSAQHSPMHSPLHSPHNTSPISASSPGLSTIGGSISPPGEAAINVSATTPASGNQQSQQHGNATPTSATIPSIIFSDYSSNSDFSREIFDTLDLDLGQMDVAGLQMLSDPSTIMIADPTIEDSFRRDLN